MSETKPVIFISYSHKDEPEHAPEGDIHWLREILSYLAPAANGTYELWTDEDIAGGADWEKEIKTKLAACDICILFVSRHSLATKYVIEIEIETILERQRRGHSVQIYPIVLSPFPQAAAPPSLLALNQRPRLDRPLSGFSRHERGIEISKIADEIVGILSRKPAVALTAKTEPPKLPAFVHVTGLPETAYERLVGREAELKRLDDAWADPRTNILSLIAEGGAGKSALVNEWLKRLQVDNYRGAEAVLGWSFYSQGNKERATSAEQFLNWALDKLGIKVETTSAPAKGDAIAEALAQRRVLLVLDGVEPLQHGLDTQQGELKDLGLRALLRRFASIPPMDTHGLIVLTSRLPVKDIARWKDAASSVLDVEQLSDGAGSALLRDNGVWGTDRGLKAAAHDFGGQPLALGLLASFLKETQRGDVRRRDHIRAFFADPENPRHDHAKRVMECYEKEWLASQPVLQAIMYIVGLFDRPASGDCLRALRKKPAIKGLTDKIIKLDDGEWQRAVARLRDARLLAPPDPSAADALDAHPLVREWFGARLRQTNEMAWRAAHGRLYEHLCDTTKEGETPTLEDLTPLYQAIFHGCHAGWHQQTLDKIYKGRICRRRYGGEIEFYASQMLGAYGSNLAAIYWFFEEPYVVPVATLSKAAQSWVLGEAAFALRAEGRFDEAMSALNLSLVVEEIVENWPNAAINASNLSEVELLSGNVAMAVATAERAVAHADQSNDEFRRIGTHTTLADAFHAAGYRSEAQSMFMEAERAQRIISPQYPLLYSLSGYRYWDLLLSHGDYAVTLAQALKEYILPQDRMNEYPLLSQGLHWLARGRANFGLAFQKNQTKGIYKTLVRSELKYCVDRLRAAGTNDHLPRGLLARAAFRRSIGDWDGATRDLDEVEEIAEPGPMRLFLCDMALERARLAFAKFEAFAPLHGMLDNNPPRPVAPDEAEAARLKEKARTNLATARKLITDCGYHRRDEELAELEAVLRGEKKFADLPPRV